MPIFLFFFFNDTATTEIYTLSLHDALPISLWNIVRETEHLLLIGVVPLHRHFDRDAFLLRDCMKRRAEGRHHGRRDRKSTRLNSSHGYISYAVFCLKKKKKHTLQEHLTSNP